MATYVVPSAVVVEVLSNENYENWRCCMKSYLLAQGLWDIVEPTTGASDDKNAEVDSKPPDSEEAAKANSQTSDNQEAAPVVDPHTRPPNEKGSEVDSKAPDNEEVAKADSHTTSDNQEGAGADTIASDNQEIAKADSKAPDNQEGAQANSKKDVDYQEIAKVDSKAPDNQERAQTNSEAWCKRNAAALHAIQISCSPDIISKIRTSDSAKEAWDALENMQKLQLQTAEPLLLGENASLVQNAYTRWLELNKLAYSGNWDSVKRFLDHHPDAINAKITSNGGTALHVATVGVNMEVGEKLVEFMSPEDLEIVDNYGNTALDLAACLGTEKMAKCMIRKNKKLVNLLNGIGRIPVVESCCGNHKDLTHYLYFVTPLELLNQDNGCHGSLLLQFSITCKMFGTSYPLQS
ncbi:unnamed protein product [Dovyalis caffra]|uniref:DUF4219 domain-containing protein n=1 Tax=Dovyalis caffra TaxID=77055 RepID=A0AAV1QU31_9ROSI|nr:unnamed protein product [Dovyalis caffra]